MRIDTRTRPSRATWRAASIASGCATCTAFAVKPDLALYFRVPIEVSIERLLARRVKLKFYEAGMDMGWSTNPVESFRLFQGKVIEEYDSLVDEYGLHVLDAAGTITDQQRVVRQLVARELEGFDDEQTGTG